MNIKDYFVKDEKQLVQSVHTFFDASEYWRELTSSHPKYFVHLLENGIHRFGLSKFCAYNGISVIDYVQQYRYETDGHTTQKYIAKVIRKKWIPFSDNSNEIQNAFKNWFYSFFPSEYDLGNISILSLNEIKYTNLNRRSNTNKQSPVDLQNSLRIKNEIGKVGEEIAFKYEVARLRNLGIKNPESHIDKTYERNVKAGFDIWSKPSKKESRYIEVKSTTKDDIEFFITSNEIEVLKKLKDSAFIYFVFIEDLKSKTGNVILELRNPIDYLEKTKSLKPILFFGKFINQTV